MQKILTFGEWGERNLSLEDVPSISGCKYGCYQGGPGDTDEAYCKKFDMYDIEFYYNNTERPHTHICEDCPYYTYKDGVELFELYRKYVRETEFWNKVEECGGYGAYLILKESGLSTDQNFQQEENTIGEMIETQPVSCEDKEFLEN